MQCRNRPLPTLPRSARESATTRTTLSRHLKLGGALTWPSACRSTRRARAGETPRRPRPVRAVRRQRAPASLEISRSRPPVPALPARFWPPSCCSPRTTTPRNSRSRTRSRWTRTPTSPCPTRPGPHRPTLGAQCVLPPRTLQTRRCSPRHRRRPRPASASPARGPTPSPPAPACRRRPARTSRVSLRLDAPSMAPRPGSVVRCPCNDARRGARGRGSRGGSRRRTRPSCAWSRSPARSGAPSPPCCRVGPTTRCDTTPAMRPAATYTYPAMHPPCYTAPLRRRCARPLRPLRGTYPATQPLTTRPLTSCYTAPYQLLHSPLPAVI